MAEFVTELFCKNVEQEQFKKWIEEKEKAFSWYYTKEDPLMKNWDVGICYECGHSGYFWESMALEMINSFNDIVFEGHNSVGDYEGMVVTDFICDGKEIKITRYIDLPSDYDDEEEDEEEAIAMREYLEAENDIPYDVTFSVNEVMACFKIYNMVSKNLNDAAQVKSACDEHKVSKEKFMQFATILDFDARSY